MLNTDDDLTQDELIELASAPYGKGCAERVHPHAKCGDISTLATYHAVGQDPMFYALVSFPWCRDSTFLYETRSIALSEGERLADAMSKELEEQFRQFSASETQGVE
jgi:hypothetical protein